MFIDEESFQAHDVRGFTFLTPYAGSRSVAAQWERPGRGGMARAGTARRGIAEWRRQERHGGRSLQMSRHPHNMCRGRPPW